MKTTIARRLGVVAAGASLALGALAPTAAQAATAPSAALGADWIAGDLPASNIYTNPYGTPPPIDAGLTIDAGLAAVAVGDTALVARVQQGAEVNATSLAAANASPGATAKALAFATRSGADPRSFGGLDLVALMESRVDSVGRLNGSGSFGIFGQALAAQGLRAAGSTKGAAAVKYLRGLQCGSGAFGANLPAAGKAPTCTADPDDTSADNTAFAALALTSLTATASINATIDRAATFLVSVGQDGGYTDGFSPDPNSSSTGLAAALLGASCRVSEADSAADVLRALQVPAGASGPLEGESGAVAPTQAALETAQANGIDDPFDRDSFRRSTTQAVTGMIWDTSAPAGISLTGPAAQVVAGSAQTLTVTGVAKGETLCLTTPTGVTRLVGTGASITVPVTAPVAGSATYAATTGPGTATATVTTATATAAAPPVGPGTATSTVTTAAAPPVAPITELAADAQGKRFAPGDRVKVTLVGVSEGQKIVVKVDGQRVKKTRAKAAGDKVTFRLPKNVRDGKTKVKIKVDRQAVTFKLKLKR